MSSIQVARKADWLVSNAADIYLGYLKDLFPCEISAVPKTRSSKHEYFSCIFGDRFKSGWKSQYYFVFDAYRNYYYLDANFINHLLYSNDKIFKFSDYDHVENNGTTLEVSRTVTGEEKLYLGNSLYYSTDNVWYGYFKSPKLNLVPCTLLISIGGILSSDGKVHEVGECGMWDTINNKFYGNTSTTGSFTVQYDDPEADPEYIYADVNSIYKVNSGSIKKLSDCFRIKDGVKQNCNEIFRIKDGVKYPIYARD